MQRQYTILAGPQAAGKSTLIKGILNEDSSVIPLQESRQIIVHKHKRKGAIFMSRSNELDVIHHDMQRMFRIKDEAAQNGLYLDETNVFTLGHALAHGIDLVEGYFKQYCDVLMALDAAILFIDVAPAVSWDRRRNRYAQRLVGSTPDEFERTMTRYRFYLDRLYPELRKLYDRLDFPKARVCGSGSVEQTLASALAAFRRLRARGEDRSGLRKDPGGRTGVQPTDRMRT